VAFCLFRSTRSNLARWRLGRSPVPRGPTQQPGRRAHAATHATQAKHLTHTPHTTDASAWRKAGFAILFDDLVAAFCTLLVIAVWRFVYAPYLHAVCRALAELLLHRRWMLATAESCTAA